MNATDLCFTPATRLAEMIRTKAVSPVEVMRAVLERVARLNPTLNAFCTLLADQAMDQARAAEQAVMQGARVGARLRAAGGIFLCKTTTPEFGWKGLSDCPLTGATRNPWNTAMTTGGSSAGAGAAVAAGLGPLAPGSAGARPTRIPLAFCGVFGHKPSYGRVPQFPVSNNDYSTHNGPMTRTVADAALMLSVMAGPDPCDRTALDAAPADYVGLLGQGVRGLRVAWSPDLGGLRVDSEVAEVVQR